MSNFLTMWYDPKTYTGKSGTFSSQKVTPEAIDEPDYYAKLRETIGNRLQGLISQGPEQYSGQYAAPLTGLENQSLTKLGEFANQGTPSLVGEGQREISKTLAGGYDPETSAYYQAYRNMSLRNLEESKRRFNEDAAGAGRFFHGGRLAGLEKLEADTTSNLNVTNAQLADQERQRMLGVLPQGLAYANAETQFPLEAIAALQNYGGLERLQVENPQLAAQYAEFVRQISQGRSDLSQANQFAGPIPYAYPQYEQPMFLQYLNAIAGVGKAAAPSAAACHVAEVLYGLDDVRTHLARAYVATHDSQFLRAYRQHSRKWAAWLKDHADAIPLLKPIWDAMVARQAAEVMAN